MAKPEKQNTKQNRKANIAVIIVVSITALVLIAIGVMCGVNVDPTRALEKPEYYDFYDLSSTEKMSTNSTAQSNINVAVGNMQFSVISAVLQWQWDYDYNFKRKKSNEKYELTVDELNEIKATETEYMIEFVYPTVGIKDGKLDYASAQTLTVDGETVYFDRLKMLIGNSNGTVGTISLFPYLSYRMNNQSDDEALAPDSYKVTGIDVRANTSTAYAALKELATSLKA